MSETTTQAPPATVKPGVSEARFLGSLKHIFASSYSVLGELMQNARRAGATRVDFHFDPEARSLAIQDDGVGIGNFQDLVVLAQSGWDEHTMQSERPFGMGLFSVLFAAGEVSCLSRGKRLTFTLSEVVEGELLKVVDDPLAPPCGTRIVMRQLSDKLLDCASWRSCGHGLEPYALYRQLAERALGFPIPVSVNGIELERPYAISALAGEQVEGLGFVSARAVHRDLGARMERPSHGYNRYFLQGLPIGGPGYNPAGAPTIVVHLQDDSFVPKMPDRSHLFDEPEAHRRIAAALERLLLSFLVRQKEELTPKEFVRKHWDNCETLGHLHLMNDVPWLPAKALYRLGAISENRTNQARLTAATQHLLDPEFVERADVEAKRIVLWRYAPDGPSDTAAAAVILKVMQREGIHQVTGRLPPDHWVHQCTADASAFKVHLAVENVRGNSEYLPWSWTSSVSIRLADEAVVTLTAGADLVATVPIENDWLLVPSDWESGMDAESLPHGDVETVCFLLGSEPYRSEHPADAFSDYLDDEEYREDWQTAAVRQFESLVSAMRGESLARVVATALDNSDVSASSAHSNHMVVVRTTRRWRAADDLFPPAMNAVCLQSEAFWHEFAERFAASEAATVQERLRDAFAATVRPGEVLGEPDDKPTTKATVRFKDVPAGNQFFDSQSGEYWTKEGDSTARCNTGGDAMEGGVDTFGADDEVIPNY